MIMIGDTLVKNGIISPEQLSESLQHQTKTKEPLGKILVKLGYCFEDDIAYALCEQFGMSYIELTETDIADQIVKSIPANLALRHIIMPFKLENNTLHIACLRPVSSQLNANLQRLTGKRHLFYITNDATLVSSLKKFYSDDRGILDNTLQDHQQEQSTSEILDELIVRASRMNASDIHFEPAREGLRIRFRIDGVLRQITEFNQSIGIPLVSRVKILANMDIAEKRAPQDGGFVFETMQRPVDIRVSVLPTIKGEKAVLRLLPVKKEMINLESLGMEKDTLKTYTDLIKRPHGIILITGPTGSGKSTTLYASLSLINSESINITTVEDPVEYKIDGVNQLQVDRANKITFPTALRNILRQDPDIIMIGEIRDRETADIALRSALTGHLVFATLHTNDATSALTRLVDIGCEPYLVSSTVTAIVAQRLIRRNCEFCKQSYTPSADLSNLGSEQCKLWHKGKGCRRCNRIGYSGRTGIFELLEVNEQVQREIINNSSAERIRQMAVSSGMKTLREDALLKAKHGVTSAEEIMRVTVLN